MKFTSAIIKAAWKIRKEAAAKYGCPVSEISWKLSLKMALSAGKEEKKMTKEEVRKKVEEIAPRFFHEEKFSKTYHSQSLKLWEKGDKFRIYVPRNAYEQAGYITFEEKDVYGKNTGSYRGFFWSATRPGNTGYFSAVIDALLNS